MGWENSDQGYDRAMKNNVGGWVLFVIALPAVIAGHLYVLGACCLFFAEFKSLRYQGAGVLTSRFRPWFSKRWRYSTTLGRGILYGPWAYDASVEIDNRTEMHEFVHIRQFENCCAWGLLGGLIATIIAWLLGLGAGEGFALWGSIWALSWIQNITNNLTAMLVFGWKGLYRDAEHERSAYAQTDMIRFLTKDGKQTSWEKIRDAQREQADGIG